MTVLLVDGGLQTVGGCDGQANKPAANKMTRLAHRGSSGAKKPLIVTSSPTEKKPSPVSVTKAAVATTKRPVSAASAHSQQQTLSPEHRHAIGRLVADARLPDDFWNYYKAGRGRLTVPATTPLMPAKVTSVVRPVSSEMSATAASNLPKELETVNQFLIFLNALRLFSFFQLASQLESVVLPDRCIRVSLSGSFRRRGELQLCIGISRLRLPLIDSSGVVCRQWIRCCRFKPRQPNKDDQLAGQLHQQQDDALVPASSSSDDPMMVPLLDHAAVDCADVDVGLPPSPAANRRSDQQPRRSSLLQQKPQPVLAGVVADATHKRLQTAGHRSKEASSRNRRNSKKWFYRLFACCTAPPKTNQDVDLDEDDDDAIAMSASRRNLYKPDDSNTTATTALRSDLCSPAHPLRPVSVDGSTSSKPVSRSSSGRNKPNHQVPSSLLSQQLAVDIASANALPHQQSLNDGDSALLRCVHEHFVKTCVEEPLELSEFVEKTIGALFFDVRGSDVSSTSNLASFDECCGLDADAGSGGSSHVAVSICFTSPLQISKLERSLGDRSFLSAVKNIVFPYVYRPASASFLSSSLSSSSSAGPASPSATGTDGDDSCHVRSPRSVASMASPASTASSSSTTKQQLNLNQQQQQDADSAAGSPVLTLSPSDVELFVVVRQTSLRSVISELDSSIVSSTNTSTSNAVVAANASTTVSSTSSSA